MHSFEQNKHAPLRLLSIPRSILVELAFKSAILLFPASTITLRHELCTGMNIT